MFPPLNSASLSLFSCQLQFSLFSCQTTYILWKSQYRQGETWIALFVIFVSGLISMHENIRPPLTLLINDATEKIRVWFCICFIMEQLAELGAELNLCLSGQVQSNWPTPYTVLVPYTNSICIFIFIFFTSNLTCICKHCPANLCTLHFGPPTDCLDGFQSVRTVLTMCGEFQNCPDNFNTFLKEFNTVRTVLNRTYGFKTQHTFYA